MKKTMTEQEALSRLTALCSQAEHCSHDIVEKMRKWEIAEDTQARIMAFLTERKFVDNERFCRAFANDKVLYSKWGRRKVEQALFLKQIPEDIRRRVLDEIDDDTYLSILRPLLSSKRRSTTARNEYERNGKLIRFAMQRGFTMDLIRQCLEVEDD